MEYIDEYLSNIETMCIAGHIRPDGDCTGATMALYLYVRENYPNIKVDIYLDNPKDVFNYMKNISDVKIFENSTTVYDLYVTCDVSDPNRIGMVKDLLPKSKKSICIDHHISNKGFADINYIKSDISSCCEVLFGILKKENINKDIATCLYTGMIHDTGVFQYASTTPETMKIAAFLMEKGVDFQKIIEESFYQRTFNENKALGFVLDKSELLLDNKLIFSSISLAEMKKLNVLPKDLDSIVSQLRLTKGTEIALFLYEKEDGEYKGSFRSNGEADASLIASKLGGGGHIKAAGFEIRGTVEEILNKIIPLIKEELQRIEA